MSRNRISLTVLFAALAAATLLFVPATAAAQVHLGVYGGWYGPYGYGYWGPYYSPYGWGPYWGPYYGPYGYYGYYGPNPLGEVRIKSPDKNAGIYINGAYAGRAGDLKRFYLKPGTYTIEQRIGGDVQKQSIYVISNRTVKIEFGPPGAGVPKAQPPPRN
jgi:hypothetical protein